LHKHWTADEDSESFLCTNGLEATNKVIKDEVTDYQLLPVVDFCDKMMSWLEEISYKWDPNKPNHIPFAFLHPHSNAEQKPMVGQRIPKKQLCFIEEHNCYVTVVSSVPGDLTWSLRYLKHKVYLSNLLMFLGNLLMISPQLSTMFIFSPKIIHALKVTFAHAETTLRNLLVCTH
jgi:hypothetical protein